MNMFKRHAIFITMWMKGEKKCGTFLYDIECDKVFYSMRNNIR